MAEVLPLPDPASPDVNDGVQEYDLAVGFETLVDAQAVGVEWFTPISPPGITPTVKWWRVSDQALLASKSFTASSGVRQQIMFDVPVALPAGEYRVSVHTIFFTLTFGWSGWPASSDNMVTGNPDGWLSVGPGFPTVGTSSLYHVAPIIELGAEPAEGAVEGALGLQAALTGARASSGAVEGALGLQAALTGARASEGQAGAAIAFTPALAGARPALGGLAAGLGLTVALQGTNGESGRPVEPFPFPPGPVSGFPWATRPVRSFQEVPTP